MSKVHARSYEITNKPLRTPPLGVCTLLYYKKQTVTTDDVKKMKNRRKQNFEGEANNMQLDKEDTRGSN